MNSLPKTVTRQRRDCDLNLDPSASESSTLTTRLPSHTHEYFTIELSAEHAHSRITVDTGNAYARLMHMHARRISGERDTEGRHTDAGHWREPGCASTS